MTKGKILEELNLRMQVAKSAWERGVISYATDLLEYIPWDTVPTKKMLLNGANDWKQYSYGGCALCYNIDIANRLCSPSEFKKFREGNRNPNYRENWLDVQARALFQASELVLRLARREV